MRSIRVNVYYFSEDSIHLPWILNFGDKMFQSYFQISCFFRIFLFCARGFESEEWYLFIFLISWFYNSDDLLQENSMVAVAIMKQNEIQFWPQNFGHKHVQLTQALLLLVWYIWRLRSNFFSWPCNIARPPQNSLSWQWCHYIDFSEI